MLVFFVQMDKKWYPGKIILGKDRHEGKMSEQRQDLEEAQV